MTEPSSGAFVHTSRIRTTPERLWQALTDNTFLAQYWGATFDTDWKTGSPMVWHYGGATMDGANQVVLAAEPYRLLSYTWHAITPGFAEMIGIDEPTRARLDGESRSKVTFEIEPTDDGVQLTVVHDGFDEDSEILPGISEGWPDIVGKLTKLLEDAGGAAT